LNFISQAGAVSIHFHMMSDMSKNLFKRAIAFSGNAFVPWAIPPNENFARKLGKAMGFNGTTEAQLLEFLENAKHSDIAGSIFSVFTPEQKHGLLQEPPVGPVIEPSWSKTSFLPQDPIVAARTAWSNNIDAIFFVNEFEGLYMAHREYTDDINAIIDTFNSNSAYFAPLVQLKLDSSSSQAKIYGQRIKNLYFNSTSSFSKDTLLQFYKVGVS
jgi:carboxylesterase type B